MIDVSDRTALAICDVCGRRELHTTHAGARAALARHEGHAHPGILRARKTEHEAATRRAGSQMTANRGNSAVL